MRILAIGDIHGCSTALRTLLNVVQPGADDILVTIGDYIDRGPDSKGVLDTLLELEQTTQLKALTGNHEILFTEAAAGRLEMANWLAVGGHETLQSYSPGHPPSWSAVSPEHLTFLAERCLRYWEIDSHFFVHANANAVLPLPEQTDDWLFWTRFENAYPHVSGKTMVCGHTAQKEGIPTLKPQAICIDTWVYGMGWLTCMDVKAGTFTQANQAGQIRKITLDDLETPSLNKTQPVRLPGNS
jgi:serine/threonine protein phosphatase 1